MLYRVFPKVAGAAPSQDGGPLYVDRTLQGPGRHDNPTEFAALYMSRQAESAVAERIKWFQGRTVTPDAFQRVDGRPYALATLDDSGLEGLVDLDDPRELIRLGFRPSQVATHHRDLTQRMALSVFQEGATGMEWWSTIEASWANVTVFAERAADRLQATGEPEPLSVRHPMVMVAAEFLGIRLTD